MSNDLSRERRNAVFAVVSAIVILFILLGAYWQGPQEVVLVASIVFVLGYIVERVRLYRTIARLHAQV